MVASININQNAGNSNAVGMDGLSSSSRDDDQTNRENEGRFECDLCRDASFATKMGLSQHRRQAHPVEYNSEIRVGKKKARWSGEEIRLLAAEEARASMDSNVRFMNQHLFNAFPDRSLEAIKKQRQSTQYKALVSELKNTELAGRALVAEGPELAEEIVADLVHIEDDGVDVVFIECIKGCMNKVSSSNLRQTKALVAIAQKVVNAEPWDDACLTDWLSSCFPNAVRPKGISLKKRVVEGNSGKIRKRREYAFIQRLYRKDFGAAARHILSGHDDAINWPSTEETVNFWKQVFEGTHTRTIDRRSNVNRAYVEEDNLRGLWKPVTAEEIRACELAERSAAGPDGITVQNWRKVNADVRALFYNLLLKRGSLCSALKLARTVLLPKGTGDITPSETRPISISSVVVRQLHKILASRLQSLHKFSDSQKAFIACDGTMENVSILSAILADARMERKELHIASLDLRKAFDSVSHEAILDTISAMGCPKTFISYIKDLYTESKTILQYNLTDTILNIKRGVLQGDPLSPLLFNAVIDRAIKQLPDGVGYKIHGLTTQCIAYADDVILVASTKVGLQTSINAFTGCLASFGLMTNEEKSSTLSLVPAGKDKKVKVIDEPLFKVNGNNMKAIGIADVWKYLGIRFTGTTHQRGGSGLFGDLKTLDRAPLKPQQRLRILKNVVIPKYLHAQVLGKINMGTLRSYDQGIRAHVRRWLRFPKDLPLAYYYADVKCGGLGVPYLQQMVPLVKLNRLKRFVNKNGEVARSFKESFFIKRELEWCNVTLNKQINSFNITKAMKSKYWELRLGNMVDTCDLNNAKACPVSSAWVEDRSHDISGEDYIHYHHIRAGCLPSKARTTRGRADDRLCRAGCMVSETNYHVVQVCQRTHGGRVHRHDRVVDLLEGHLKNRPHTTVLKEPKLKTTLGLRKPDLVVTQGEKSIVLDVQIVSGKSMSRDHINKKNKYKDIVGFSDIIQKRCNSRIVTYDAITISFKGLFAKETIRLFDTLKITEQLRFMIVTSVLRGTWLNWNGFNRSTSRAHGPR